MKKGLLSLGFAVFMLCFPLAAHAQVIHEVQSGDSLSSISKQYGVKSQTLAKLNGLAKNSGLVLGQALLLPGTTYIVQNGESLWEIAKRHAITEASLKKANRLPSSAIRKGQKLYIPHPPKTMIWNGAYFVPKDQYFNEWILGNYRKTLSAAFVFEYPANYDGSLTPLATENKAITEAWKKGIPPYATVTNISSKGFDPALAHHLMANTARRKAFINNIYSLLHAKNYKGVVIDFEQVWPKDRHWLNLFMKELGARVHPAGMQVLIAVPPKEGDKVPSHSAAYDYKSLGKSVDKLFLMTYDWHWPGGPSGPIAPINRVRATIRYALTVAPKSKIMLGIPQYAYDWDLSGSSRQGKAYSAQRAVDLYTGYRSQIRYDEQAAAPSFRYVDKDGSQHEVWFEDPRSLMAKFHLVKEFGLYGIGAWHLGLTMPQTERILMDEFIIKR
ncbi:glycosyl hydrolase family 18 protein [Paenibacillus gansuensis]|uniref:Glycosyl hydrolase family 18 protein n=1 Tax=Paenibacillus gansuensis TaxID=306542 RepID=A0ABW5PF18_9BACL